MFDGDGAQEGDADSREPCFPEGDPAVVESREVIPVLEGAGREEGVEEEAEALLFFRREALESLSASAERAWLCCWRHLARRFLNQT